MASWQSCPGLTVARGGLTTAAVGDRVCAAGGYTTGFGSTLDSVELRDPVGGAWTRVVPMKTPHGNPAAAGVDGRLYVIGGVRKTNDATNQGEVYDLATRQWDRIKNRPGGPVVGPGSAALDGRVYVVGGGKGKDIGDVVTVYDPGADRWSGAAPMPTARMLFRAVALDGLLYAVGGLTVEGKPFTAAVERYDPGTDSWTAVRPMGTGRGNPGVVATGGKVYVVGGAEGILGVATTALTTGEVYDPQTDTWSALEPLPVGRASLGAEIAPDGSLLAIGGFEAGGVASARVESLAV